MGFPSLIDRELRSAARNPRTYRLRLAAGLLGTLVGLAVILPGAHNIALVGTSSRGVFWWMAALMQLYGMGMALFLAGDALPSERQARTLELLRLTRLSPTELLIGKLVSTGLGALQGIMAFSLTLAVAILAGGVTLGEYVRVMALTMNAVFLALSIGLLASCLIRDGRVAAIAGLIMLLLLCSLPLLMDAKTTGGAGPTTIPFRELMSPFGSFKLADPHRSGVSQSSFWLSLGIQHLLAWCVIGLASHQLRRTWVSEQASTLQRVRAFLWRQERSRPESADEDKETMEDNPILWLLVRKYVSAWHRLVATGALIVTSAILFLSLSRFFTRTEASFFVLLSWHVLIKLWVAWIATHLMTEMRRSGMLELTLTSPLDWRLILDGWLIGLKKIFFIPFTLIILADLLIAVIFGGRFTAVYSGPGWLAWIVTNIVVLLFESYALTWLGLRLGMSALNTTRAWLSSIAIILWLPWFFVASLMALGGVGFNTGVTVGWFDLVVSRTVSGLFVTIGATAWAIDQLRSHQRESLASPQI